MIIRTSLHTMDKKIYTYAQKIRNLVFNNNIKFLRCHEILGIDTASDCYDCLVAGGCHICYNSLLKNRSSNTCMRCGQIKSILTVKCIYPHCSRRVSLLSVRVNVIRRLRRHMVQSITALKPNIIYIPSEADTI